jgi:hypothetical protein
MLKMGSEPYILEHEHGKTVLTHEQQLWEIKNLKELKAKLKDDVNAMVCTSTAKEL